MNHQYTGFAIYNQTVMTMAEYKKSPVVAIVVSLLCVVFVTAFMTVVVVFIIHKKKQTKTKKSNITSENARYVNENATECPVENYENMPYLNEDSTTVSTYNGILAENLASYIEYAKKAGKLSTEYAELPTHDSPTEAGDEQANVPKNRFNNIKPFDHSRVVLQSSNTSKYRTT